MKVYSVLAGGLILISAMTAGCADRSAKERIAAQREGWEQSIKDSLTRTEQEIDSLKNRLAQLRLNTDSLLSRFKCVDNPKEVEKYYLPEVKGYFYPLSSNGLAARVMANEQLELVAVYSGPRFSSIQISGGGETFSSGVVAPDQALNYRSGNTTTVSFTGKGIDTIADRLAKIPTPVIVKYMEGGKKVGEVILDTPQSTALKLAAALASSRRETLLSEKKLTLLSHKAAILKKDSI